MCGIALFVSGIHIDLSHIKPHLTTFLETPSNHVYVDIDDTKAALRRRGPDSLGIKNVFLWPNVLDGQSVVSESDDLAKRGLGSCGKLEFIGATLQLRGSTPVIQPLVDSFGNVLVYNDVVAMKTVAPVYSVLQSNACTPEPKAPDTQNADSTGTSPTNRKLEALQDSFRKVLSPICSNMNIKKVSSIDQMCLILYDPKTPQTTQLCQNDMFQENATPLGRYTAQSSNLKNSLVQQYIDLLNTASKDELLELKGIGEKMAGYILELRESSPIKSLNDLEKIGLSSKQVNNMFGRAAKGLFD